MITTFYAIGVFTAISLGSYIFYSSINPLDSNFECDLDFTPPASRGNWNIIEANLVYSGRIYDYES